MSASPASFSKEIFRRLIANRGALIGLVIIVIALFTAVFAYFLAPDSSPYGNRIIVEIGGKRPGYTQDFLRVRKEGDPASTGFFTRLLGGKDDLFQYIPVLSHQTAGDSMRVEKLVADGLTETQSFALRSLAEKPVYTRHFLLGTDKKGRDILSRLIIGTRVSLSVGLITVLISLLLGLFLGSLAGYFRGRTDDIIMWFINVIWSIPTLLLVFAITLVLGKGFWQVFIAVGLTMWVNVARIVRGQTLSVRELEYIEATRALGYSHFRTIWRHILPNITGPVLVIAASNFASAIVIEAGLSFLGVGVQPPQPSWGLMIRENYTFIITQNPALALAPGFAIMLLVLAFNLLGNGLRDAFDVKA